MPLHNKYFLANYNLVIKKKGEKNTKTAKKDRKARKIKNSL